MQEFRGKVAVITGGGSGIGLAMAERFAAEGMKLVLADIQDDALAKAVAGLRAKGAEVSSVRADVSRAEDVEALAANAEAAHGAVHVVCNNAGVVTFSSSWEHTLGDWEWVLGVNLWGVIHGVRSFVPRMIARGEECHVVNTASMAGMITGAFMPSYFVSKHGVVALSEALYKELAATPGAGHVGVSVVCPGLIDTGIAYAERNRPADHPTADGPKSAGGKGLETGLRAGTAAGYPPSVVADHVFEAVRDGRFYVFPVQPNMLANIKRRHDAIQAGQQPA
jgi:NAD(P)-dependent dehydrogenase (short-subunit alcohol dehydrogenase family)